MEINEVIARAMNNAGAELSRIPNPWLGMIPRKLWGAFKNAFAYSALFNPLAASATATQTVQIQNDAHFLWIFSVATVTDTLGTTFLTAVPQFVQFSDPSSGATVFDNPMHFNNVFGSAQDPAYLPFPRVLKRASSLQVQLANQEATARIVNLSLYGIKVYPGLQQADDL